MRPHGGYAIPELMTTNVGPEFLAFFPPSYRNLFGPASLNQQFKGYGFGESEINETKRFLEAIAYRMCCPFPWQSTLKASAKLDENPNLPSGYTYFAQLIAHDLSFVGRPIPSVPYKPLKDHNFRAAALELDAVYGAGPTDRSVAYSSSGGSTTSRRRRLRLGYFQKLKECVPSDKMEARRWARDLPRIECRMQDDAQEGLTDVLIADPRTDDQPLIAQVFVLFCLLHNAVCDILPADEVGRDDQYTAARKV